MSITLNGDSGITSPTYGGTVSAEYSVPVTAFKNRIINGAMMIDQRNAGAAVTPTSNTYTVDRWLYIQSAASKFNIRQNINSVTPPVGFSNYLGVSTASLVTVGASDFFALRQAIEGFNVADLAWGTANASPITLSFKVYSSLTGTFGGTVTNGLENRSYPFTYSIPVANTWTTISITIAGDTTGTWATNNTSGLELNFGLGVGTTQSAAAGSWTAGGYLSVTGATSVVGTSGATFYITGVQLEKGSTATSFDYRPYGTELALCQRYYYKVTNYPQGLSISNNTTYGFGAIAFPATMRSTPSIDAGSTFTVNAGSAGTVALATLPATINGPNGVGLYNSASNWTVGSYISVNAAFTSEL